jgi:23S rRNA (cytosine1962-C5)-methyltransferase
MSNNHQNIAIETPQNWGKSYELIDSGGFEKLEQFGEFVVRRPEPQALWSKSLSEEFWTVKANAHFYKEKGSTERGVWDIKKGVPDKWFIPYQSEKLDLKLKISLSSFKHVGLFPEQASNWEFLAKNIPLLSNPKPKILNLFAYTGGASLVCRQMGADVTHVDSVKPVLSWARENMEVSQLDSIRWMAEDALKFVKREARRGNFYQGILLDPPAYGRGPDGEKWVLEEQIDDMLRSVKEILDPKEHILLTNVYSLGFSTLVVENLVNGIFHVPETAESGELYLNDQYDKKLPLGVFHRYLYKS